jgi:outer membrane protein
MNLIEKPMPQISPRFAFARLALVVGAVFVVAAEDAVAQDHTVLGAGIAVAPAYQGSGKARIMPLPVIDLQRGRVFANLRDGVGLAAIDNPRFTVGVSAVFVPGYRRRDVPVGVDRLSSGAGVRLFTRMRASGMVATLGAVKVVSGGGEGLIADASLSYPLAVSNKVRLTPTIGATWADRQYTDRYFGVSAREAGSSGLSRFTPGDGLKDISATLTASYRVTDRTTVSATSGFTRLMGDAAKSPLVDERSRPFGAFTISWRL